MDGTRRLSVAGALAMCLVLIGHNRALAHATLLSSEPKANAVLSASPAQIRLVFSEAVVADLSRIELLSVGAPAARLQVSVDPHDVHALIAFPLALRAGAYRVVWRIVSADGHPVDGDFVFTIGSATGGIPGAQAPPPHSDSHSHDDASGPVVAGAPVIPSLLRGAGLAAMLGLTGLLAFGLRSERAGTRPARQRRVTTWLAVTGATLLACHMAMWMLHAAPAEQLSQSWLQAAMGTAVGRMEGVRVLLALLALWALALARRPAIALFFAGACLVVSGAIGHSAAISPAIAIPSKAVHLLSIAMWLGGLAWLIIADRDNEVSFRRECHRVSAVALWSVIAITVTGALQSFLFLGGLSLSLLMSPYGAFVTAKIIGLLILMGFGAYHRLRVLPAVDAGAPSARLRQSVRKEIPLLAVVVFTGGVMAYVPTPHPPPIHVTTSGER
jgi:copper transport protein